MQPHRDLPGACRKMSPHELSRRRRLLILTIGARRDGAVWRAEARRKVPIVSTQAARETTHIVGQPLRRKEDGLSRGAGLGDLIAALAPRAVALHGRVMWLRTASSSLVTKRTSERERWTDEDRR
jgi:hypothetical protein